MTNLESRTLTISHPRELVELRESLVRLLESAAREVPGSHLQEQKLLLFFNTYFRIISSMPEGFKSEAWLKMRGNLLQAMMQADSFAAYFLFYQQMSGKISSQDLSPQAEKEFFGRMPILQKIYFGSIVDGAIFVF